MKDNQSDRLRSDVVHQAMNLGVPQHNALFFVFFDSKISYNERYIRSDFILNNLKLKKRIVFLIVGKPLIFDQLVVFFADQFCPCLASFPLKNKISVTHVHSFCKPLFQSAGRA